MRAVMYEEFGRRPEVVEVDDPTPTPTGAVVRVEATGLCRSDWHGWQGHDPDIALPHVPGHELAGTIVAVGGDVTRCHVGDRVTVPFVCACGQCEQCQAGDHQVCDAQFQPGFTHWGSFAELVAIAEADVNVVLLPEDMASVTAAALGCRFATSYRAVVAQGRVRAGEWVAIHGCGGVGLSAVMIAVAQGARVVGIDVSRSALAAAGALGAELVVNPATVDVVPAIRSFTAGGVHVSIDAVGSRATCLASIACLRKRGRHVQVGLMLVDDARASIPMDAVIAGELEILGSHGMAAHSYAEMLARVASGVLRPQQLVGRTIGLDDVPAEMMSMDLPRIGAGMTVIVP